MTQKSALIIRHVPYEGVAGFRAPIEAAGYHVDRIDVADPGFSGLDLSEPDLLIMMGGPMGVYEHEEHPWIRCQLGRLARRLDGGRPTLGVCFGAQMMAAAMGGEVYPGPAKEVGFGPVTVNDAARGGPLRHIVDVPVLHWHGDTFTLPDDVELLASSPLYPHQAFRRGPGILALQFHAEMGLDPRFEAWLAQAPDVVTEVGGEAKLRAEHDTLGPGAVAAGQAMIAEWLEGFA
jgi:GMP synthase (glutamine-hydrolysing)